MTSVVSVRVFPTSLLPWHAFVAAFGSGARCDSPLDSTGTHSFVRSSANRAPFGRCHWASSGAATPAVWPLWSVATRSRGLSFFRSFNRAFGPSIVGVRPSAGCGSYCGSACCWLLVLMFCSGAFNVSSALVASTPHATFARGNRDSRLSIGASCVRHLQLSSCRVFCFVISSHLRSLWLPCSRLPAAAAAAAALAAVAAASCTTPAAAPRSSRRVRKPLADFSRCYRVAPCRIVLASPAKARK